MTEAGTYATTLDTVRNYTRWYLSKLKGQDLHRQFTAEGIPLNTAYWLFAHVVSSENWLILRGTEGEMIKLPWAKLFNFGQAPPRKEELPPIEEIIAAGKEVHSRALEHLTSLSGTDLTKPHQAKIQLGGDGTYREIITHCIRHEGGHAGQLGLLCKLYGVQTI